MADESGYVTGWAGVHGPHVIRDRPDLLASMETPALCGEMTVCVPIIGYGKETWRPCYGGCVNCLDALEVKK